jgi:hypothetical protein
MIDRRARDIFAEQLRHFAAGQITNDEFEDRLPLRSKDAAVNRIFWAGAWHLYDDMREYKLTGEYRFPKECKHEISKWILFLKTDLEYQYPTTLRVLDYLDVLLAIFTLGLSFFLIRHMRKRLIDPSIWPFSNRADYEHALANPPYLK